MIVAFLLIALQSLVTVYGFNYSQELLLSGSTPTGVATERKEGSTQGVFMGRGMILNVRIRASGGYAYESGESGLGIFYRQYSAGNLGSWTHTALLKPDDLPADINTLDAEGSASFYCGIYQSFTTDAEKKAIIAERTGMRMESNKFAIGGTPESKPFLMASAFGHTYTGAHANGFAETGQAYVFTGEFYHWTQVCGRSFRFLCAIYLTSTIPDTPFVRDRLQLSAIRAPPVR